MSFLMGSLAYLMIGALILIPVVLYVFSVSSRKSYSCPECGEQITTEYLNAKRCNMCGAPLQQKDF